MQILNLLNIDKSDITYTLSRFPDGESQITLGEIDRKSEVLVKCRITSAEELFILMQVADILNRQSVVWQLDIYYLMGSRMDRVMDFNRPFTLKIIANVLNNLGATDVNVFEPHSDRCFYERIYQAVHISEEEYKILDNFDSATILSGEEYCLVVPDKGAYNRLGGVSEEYCRNNIVLVDKVRDITTGRIQKIEITNPDVVLSSNKKFIILDDLCDGGGTFCGIADEIRKIKPDSNLSIFVTHMVNPKGIENLSKNFNHVWFTNSYRTWENLPDNVTQIEIV